MTLPPDGGELTDAGVIALRETLVAAGFSIIPEFTGGKFGPGDWRDRQFDPSVIHVSKGVVLCNTALRLTDTWAIDIDVDQPDDVAGILEAADTVLGPARCMRYRSNSARRALLYRGEGLFRSAKGSDGAIEVFSGARAKLTSFGWHTDKTTQLRTRLQWDGVPGKVAHSELTAVTDAQIDAFLQESSDWLGDDTRIRIRVPHEDDGNGNRKADDVESLIDAMAYVDNTGPMDWHEWNKIGMALYAGSDGDERALLAFCVWTASNPLTKHRDCVKRWHDYANSPPTRLGAGTIFHHAFANGYRPIQPIDAAAKRMIEWKQNATAKRMAQNFKPLI